jgi:hypothetical protein
MALGNCRHCGAGRIPTDAPICRECCGWRPNPGFCTRMGVVIYRLGLSLVLVVLLAVCAYLGALALKDKGGGRLGGVMYLIALGPITLGVAGALIRSLIRPYGRERSAE